MATYKLEQTFKPCVAGELLHQQVIPDTITLSVDGKTILQFKNENTNPEILSDLGRLVNLANDQPNQVRQIELQKKKIQDLKEIVYEKAAKLIKRVQRFY